MANGADPLPLAARASARKRLREILAVPGDRVGKARRIASAIRESGGYRWVGLYDVRAEEIGVVAWSGPTPPLFSKIVIPVRSDPDGPVLGRIEVESAKPDAFAPEDQMFLEECARLLSPLWS